MKHIGLFIITFFVAVSFSIAQDSTNLPFSLNYSENVETKVSVNNSEFSQFLFSDANLNWNRIPQNYRGNDPMFLINNFVSIFTPKDEFESTNEYRQRIHNDANKAIINDLKPNSRMGFVKQIDSSDIKYDADAQTLNIKLALQSIKPQNRFLLPISSQIKVIPSINQRNTRTATTESLTVAAIAFANNRDYRKYLDTKGGLNFDLNLPAEQARLAKENLFCLLLFNSRQPFHGFVVIPPTKPLNRRANSYYLDGSLQSIWLFNRLSGEIYQKIDAQPIISGDINVKTNLYNEWMVLMDRNITDILKEAGITPTEKTKKGQEADLIKTMLKAAQSPNSKKYSHTFQTISKLLEKHSVVKVMTDERGRANFSDVPFGKYYLFISGYEKGRYYIWNFFVEVKDEKINIDFDYRNIYLTL